MNKVIILIFSWLLVMPFVVAGQQPVSLRTLLKEMTDRFSVAEFPNPAYDEYQASSYDRSAKSPDEPGWFGNHDFSQYIRTEKNAGREEHVMLDADGPGAIVRFWITTTPERSGTLRIYFDHEQAPSIEITGYDLMKSGLPLVIPHSSYEANGKGGSTLYLPLPFARHCKVTWEEGKADATAPRYYQINYREYAPGTNVRTFGRDQLISEKRLIEATKEKLWNPPAKENGRQVRLEKDIAPGQTISARLPEGASALTYMALKVASADPANEAQALRSTVLNISFDGQQTVSCPIGDFSGAGVGGNVLRSWYRTVTEEGAIISRWIMPYKKEGTISFINLNKFPVHISLTASVARIRWSPSMMYFHTSWMQKREVPVTKWDEKGAIDLELVKIKGRGVYMGHTLAVYNHMHTWYGEGDQKIWRDSLGFPVEFGTGLEDHYNTSWAPVVLYQTPFANAPRADHPDSFGYNTFTRTRNLDAVPFHSLFQMKLGMLGWENGTADFATTIYWYGFGGSADHDGDVSAEASRILP